MRVFTYSHEELGEKPWLLDQWMDFVERAIPDEGFQESHFTGELGLHEIEKTAYVVYHPTILERVQAIAFTVKYLDADGTTEIVYLMMIAVEPESHNQGVGTRLLQHVLSRNTGCDVWVKIHRENGASKRFFKKHSFVKTTKKAMHPRLNPSYRLPYDPYVKKSTIRNSI